MASYEELSIHNEDTLASDIEQLAQAQISKWFIGKEIKNIIYVPDTLINLSYLDATCSGMVQPI